MKGIIFNIKRGTSNDGPGVRTTIFLKGCPLSCLWCLNPGISNGKEKEKPINENNYAIQNTLGRLVSVEEVWSEIQKDIAIYRQTGGGVTISGGEPLYQIEFLQNILMKLKSNNIHTIVDTTGFSSKIDFDSIVQFTDLFIYDIKHINDEIHKQFTGVSNRIIFQNFESLMKQGKKVIIRIPFIAGFNNSDIFIENLIQYLSKYQSSIVEIQLLHFLQWTAVKYHKIKENNELDETYLQDIENLGAVQNKFISQGYIVRLQDQQVQQKYDRYCKAN